jgi:uncharacterized protein (DUF1501 family)
MITRRQMLRAGARGAAVTLGAMALPVGWSRPAHALPTDPLLAVIFLRGGADGLNLIVPADDPSYYSLRPNISVQAGDEIPLDGFFGMNASLGSLLPLYDDGELAIIHAAGSPDPTRSHFDAQDFMERGAPGNHQISEGWLNRTLGHLGTGQSWAGISLGPAEVLAMKGVAASLSFTSINDFVLDDPSERRGALTAMYAGTENGELRSAGASAFDALDVIGGIDTTSAVSYANGPFGAALADAAALLRADAGVRMVALDVGGWDHHEGEPEALAPVGGQLASGLATFRDDLGADWSRTCVLVMTEFGRTAAENGSRGTDHGHGSVMFAAGGAVAGGRVVLANDAWPGLAPGQLHEGRDLAVTTDYRDVFAEVLHRHMGVPLGAIGGILPGHSASLATLPGIFA